MDDLDCVYEESIFDLGRPYLCIHNISSHISRLHNKKNSKLEVDVTIKEIMNFEDEKYDECCKLRAFIKKTNITERELKQILLRFLLKERGVGSECIRPRLTDQYITARCITIGISTDKYNNVYLTLYEKQEGCYIHNIKTNPLKNLLKKLRESECKAAFDIAIGSPNSELSFTTLFLAYLCKRLQYNFENECWNNIYLYNSHFEKMINEFRQHILSTTQKHSNPSTVETGSFKFKDFEKTAEYKTLRTVIHKELTAIQQEKNNKYNITKIKIVRVGEKSDDDATVKSDARYEDLKNWY